MLTAIHILGQIIFGGYFIYNGIKHFKDHGDYTSYAASQGVPLASASVYITGILLLLGGLGVFFNIYVGTALLFLVIFLIPVSIMMHPFWKVENPGERSSLKVAFLKNMALLGACFLMFPGFIG
jgi:putative oxidoreductase